VKINRVLVVSKAFPYPPTYGYAMRAWQVLRALAVNGKEIDLLTFGTRAELETHGETIRQICRRVDVVPQIIRSLSTGNDYAGRLWAGMFRTPYGVKRFRSNSMRAEIRSRLRNAEYDAVVCDTPYSSVNFPRSLPVPLAMSTQNIEHILLQRYLAYEKGPIKRAYAWLEWRKLRRWERDACSWASVVVVCSEHDRAAMLEICPRASIVVAPNIVEIDDYSIAGLESGPTMLYVGTLGWYPNRDAVDFFVQEILPHIRRELPSARFVVVGRGASEQFRRRLAGIAGVELAGEVPDVRTEIAKAALCVVPLRIGSGTRLKILEAAAMAKAIVSTHVGAEGLNFVDGREIVLADEPRSFARAAVSLLTDPCRRRELGFLARKRVEEQYSFPVLRAAVHEMLAELGREAQR
jgi:glycosyltransferase involved in cell wall biosynthesis